MIVAFVVVLVCIGIGCGYRVYRHGYEAGLERGIAVGRIRQLADTAFPRSLPPKEARVSLPEDTSV